MYQRRSVLQEKENIDNGIGSPNWDLVICLAIAWCIIAVILCRGPGFSKYSPNLNEQQYNFKNHLILGIRSSGKASYFLAVFPYFVMLILLLRAVTLPGSLNGIIYFLKPQWSELLNPKVGFQATLYLMCA